MQVQRVLRLPIVINTVNNDTSLVQHIFPNKSE